MALVPPAQVPAVKALTTNEVTVSRWRCGGRGGKSKLAVIMRLSDARHAPGHSGCSACSHLSLTLSVRCVRG